MNRIRWTKQDQTLPYSGRALVWTAVIADDGYAVHRIRSGIDDGLYHASVRCSSIGHGYASLTDAFDARSRSAGVPHYRHS